MELTFEIKNNLIADIVIGDSIMVPLLVANNIFSFLLHFNQYVIKIWTFSLVRIEVEQADAPAELKFDWKFACKVNTQVSAFQ